MSWKEVDTQLHFTETGGKLASSFCSICTMSRWVSDLALNFCYEYLALYFMHSDYQGLLITVA